MLDNRAIRTWLEKLTGDDVARILAKGASAAFIINVLAAMVGFGTHVALANVLGASHFGDYVYVIGWVNVLTLFTTLGLDTAAIRFIPVYTANGQHGLLRGLVARSRILTLSASLIAAAGLGIGVYIADVEPNLWQTFVVGCALLVVLTVLRLSAAQVQATKRIAQANAPIFVLRPAMVAAGIGAAYLLWTPVSSRMAMVINIASTSLALLITLWFLRRSLPAEVQASRPAVETRRWLQVMTAFVFYSGFLYLMSRVDILMVGALIGTENAGLYSVASQVAALVVFGLHAVTSIAAPVISELHEAEDRIKLRRVLKLASAASLGVAVVGAIALFVLGPWVLRAFGPEFPAAYRALCILCVGMLAYATIGLGNALMNMTNHHRPAAVVAGIALVSNIAFNALLIPRYGIEGAAIATASATVLSNLAILFYVLRRLQLNPTFLPLSWLIKK